MPPTHDRARPAGQPRRSPGGRGRPSPETPLREAVVDPRSVIGNVGMGQLLDQGTADTIETELGGGRPLDQVADAGQPSSADGAPSDPTGVRIHDDATAAQLSRDLGAVAFTFGRDVFLAGDAPALASEEGRHVLRHELTHVEQQESSTLGRPSQLSSPSSQAEREATGVAEGASPPSPVEAGANVVHRQVIDDYARWIRKPLSRGLTDWEVTDSEAMRVVGQLNSLSDGDLLDTYNLMQSDGLWNRLKEQAPSHKAEWHDLRWRLVRLGQPVLGKSSEDKRLAELKSGLSASERGFKAAARLSDDPAVRHRLMEVASGFELASRTLTKGMELTEAATSIHKFSSAAAKFWKADLRTDAGAESVVALFESVGEVGSLLPEGIWQVPFEVIGSVAGVVMMVKQAGDPAARINDERHPGLRAAVEP